MVDLDSSLISDYILCNYRVGVSNIYAGRERFVKVLGYLCNKGIVDFNDIKEYPFNDGSSGSYYSFIVKLKGESEETLFTVRTTKRENKGTKGTSMSVSYRMLEYNESYANERDLKHKFLCVFGCGRGNRFFLVDNIKVLKRFKFNGNDIIYLTIPRLINIGAKIL